MYRVGKDRVPRKKHYFLLAILLLLAVSAGSWFGYQYFFNRQTVQEKIAARLEFDVSVTEAEQTVITDTVAAQDLKLSSNAVATVKTGSTLSDPDRQLAAYVPVTHIYSTRQKLATDELAGLPVYVPEATDQIIVDALSETLGISSLNPLADQVDENQILFLPVSDLNDRVKLLEFDGSYYLDSFTSGAIFREASFSGTGATDLEPLVLPDRLNSSKVLKVNITGVTALTRVMMRKLDSVGDPLYFSQHIGEFLADADITHVSNEVSFMENCGYSYTAFCSPPEFIETLKDSGIDLVELTGNHNNDLGAQHNTDTINLYHSLGWSTVGGGLNIEEAAKPFTADRKGSKITLLAYNYPDSPNGGAIAGANKAGANSFDFKRIEAEISSARQESNFVIVNVQFWECYAYPNGYTEYPVCDKPIGEQEATFKRLIDLGADMVVGTSAHQPQTYERYKDKMIYYGLGNLYFDQTQWPGTERGIILTHYFSGGKLLATKLTPTRFDRDLQTRLMTDEEAAYLLTRLDNAR